VSRTKGFPTKKFLELALLKYNHHRQRQIMAIQKPLHSFSKIIPESAMNPITPTKNRIRVDKHDAHQTGIKMNQAYKDTYRLTLNLQELHP
jgi:hypothetical protein